MGETINLKFMLVALMLGLFLKKHTSFGADTIFANQSLSGDQTIVSSGGVFEFGFFKAGNTSNYYIGMWYKQIPSKTVVWVANRERPVLDRFLSELTISNGELVLFNESKVPIWSTNVNTSADSQQVRAVLLDDGNLVLKKDGSNSTKPLWESFDHPTNTWLPGAKLGYDYRTKKKQLLTSWKNLEDPSPGLFSLEIIPSNKSFVMQWNRSEPYWSSGSWNGQIFSGVPEMRRSYIYDFSFVANENETYFTYSVYPWIDIISQTIIDFSGQFRQENYLPVSGQWNLFWSQPRQVCQVYGFCGVYGTCNEKSLPFCNCFTGFQPKSQSGWDIEDYSGGCSRKTELRCSNSTDNLAHGESDKFLEMPSVLLPNNKKSVEAGNLTACELTCSSNCSCTAYSYGSDGCSIWTEALMNLQQLTDGDSRGKTLYLRLAASELKDLKNNKGLNIGVVVGAVSGAVVLVCFVLFFVFRQRRNKYGTGQAVEGSLIAFGYRDLQIATKNFSEKLGGGGFGSVFKGVLPDSTLIAVKKLENIGQGEKQFRTEVSTIGTIQHVNLIRLRGFCSQGANRLLVYDYMSNGSLDSQLFEEKSSNILNWGTRFRIALGTARGLVYLHEKCRDCIIHCDIKPENILLDAEFCPKVADFGLAKLVGREFSRVLTTMRGTRGYLAPEWIAGAAITPKADVYSYGMMLFELVSGRRNTEQSKDGKVNFFPTLALSILVEGGHPFGLLDPRLDGNAEIDELERVLKVAFWCIQDEEAQRPSISQVVQILEGAVHLNLPPAPRFLQFYVDNKETIIFFGESESKKSCTAQGTTSTDSSAEESKCVVLF